MSRQQPYILFSPEIQPAGEFWFNTREVGPTMGSTFVCKAFFGWGQAHFNNQVRAIIDEYDVPWESFSQGRRYYLYDVERISHVFLNRSIIDYSRFYCATQVLKAMGSNYKLL